MYTDYKRIGEMSGTELLETLATEGITAQKIAEHFNITASSVYYHRDKALGVKRPPSIKSLEDRLLAKQNSATTRAEKAKTRVNSTEAEKAEKAAAREAQKQANEARRQELMKQLADLG